MKKNRNGFTLIELLLVISLLAIVIAITIPLIMEITETSRRKAFYLYALNLVQKATEKYVSTYSDLDEYTYDEFNSASCVTYNIQTDLGIKNTGDYKGWAQVIRTEQKQTKTYDSNGVENTPPPKRLGIIKYNITPSESDQTTYYNEHREYMPGILYPKYCITKEGDCTPERSINVQENQYTLEVKKILNKDETLCVNRQVVQKVDGKDTLVTTDKKCITYNDTTGDGYINDNEDIQLTPLVTDYKYDVILSFIDNTYVIENINMEGMTEKEFVERLDAELAERASWDAEDKLVIHNLKCSSADPDETVGRRTITPPPETTTRATLSPSNLQLDTLTVSNCNIDFNSGQMSYSCEVPNSVTSVNVYAKAMKDTTSVDYPSQVNLSIGRNVITINLRDEANDRDGRYIVYVNRLNTNTTRTTVSTTTTTRSTRSKGVVVYTTREITTAEGAPDPSLPESNAQLEFLTISKHQDFEFDPDVYYYDLKVDKDEDMLYLNYRAKNPNATVIVTGNSNLKNGSQVEILVRSENDYYTKSYVINIYREGSVINYTLVFRILAIVLGIVLAVVLIWLTLARHSMRPRKDKRIQVITKTTQNDQTKSVFDSTPKKVVINTNQNNQNNNNNNNSNPS